MFKDKSIRLRCCTLDDCRYDKPHPTSNRDVLCCHVQPTVMIPTTTYLQGYRPTYVGTVLTLAVVCPFKLSSSLLSPWRYESCTVQQEDYQGALGRPSTHLSPLLSQVLPKRPRSRCNIRCFPNSALVMSGRASTALPSSLNSDWLNKP